jgi:peptidoglycan hydrolase CwlO-like protein
MEDYVLHSVDNNNDYYKENNYLKNYNETTINNLKTELMYLKNIVYTLNNKIDDYKKENSELKTIIYDLNNKHLKLS